MNQKMKWRKLIHETTDSIEAQWSSLIQQIYRELRKEEIYVQSYLGYGTADAFYVRGRVLEGEKLKPATADDTLWENLAATYQRFETDEIAGAKVTVKIEERTVETITNREGYFSVQVIPPASIDPEAANHPLWHELALTAAVPEPHVHKETNNSQFRQTATTTQVLVPPAYSDFGIISDLDDTVLQTNAANLLEMARLTFLHNARTRLPFPGVAEFYQALHRGPNGNRQNPIFYVSSSPWNLYDLLTDFLDVHNIPHGPLFLRDLGFNRKIFTSSGHHSHKLTQVEHLLQVYPSLAFILIGDSGQEDPEIYYDIVQRFPNRVKAIYIRDVSLDERDIAVDNIIQTVNKADVAMLRVSDTVAAAKHAVATGIIHPDALSSIEVGKENDKAEL